MRRFAAAANYVGISSQQLVALLKDGVSVSEVLDIIQLRLEAGQRGSGLVA